MALWRRVLNVLAGPQLRAWRGEASAAATFWAHGVLASLVLVLGYIDAELRHDRITKQALLTLFMLYTPWALVALWRCAGGSKPPWDFLWRLIVVAWAGNALMLAGSIQIALLFDH